MFFIFQCVGSILSANVSTGRSLLFLCFTWGFTGAGDTKGRAARLTAPSWDGLALGAGSVCAEPRSSVYLCLPALAHFVSPTWIVFPLAIWVQSVFEKSPMITTKSSSVTPGLTANPLSLEELTCL